MKKLHSLQEAADSLGISVGSLRNHAWKGIVRTVKLGRRRLIPNEELERISREGFTPSSVSQQSK